MHGLEQQARHAAAAAACFCCRLLLLPPAAAAAVPFNTPPPHTHPAQVQTIESINLLKMRKTPFIIALNKVDRLYKWDSVANSPIQDAFERQPDFVIKEFGQRFDQVGARVLECACAWGLCVWGG